jgi:hypothetical protein
MRDNKWYHKTLSYHRSLMNHSKNNINCELVLWTSETFSSIPKKLCDSLILTEVRKTISRTFTCHTKDKNCVIHTYAIMPTLHYFFY